MPAIYPRSSWSSAAYDKRTKKVWPAEIEAPKVIIVHHTAMNYKGATSKQIKKIYRYHSYSRKWGDIGYNYIIGKDGLIFEGRYGGNGVIGGHSYYDGTNYNNGSIGIAILGNYVGESLSSESLDSLQKLTGWLAANNDISINEDYKFFNKKLSSRLIGHKDVASTACPGKNIYNNLSSIRSSAVNFSSSYRNYAYQISGESGKYEISGGKRYSGSARSAIATISETQLEAYPLAGQAENDESTSETAYPSGTLVKISAEGKRGIIESGVLRTINSEGVFSSSYDNSSFVEIASEKWEGYSNGAAAGFRNGAFARDSGGNYFIFSANQKRKLNLSSEDLKLINLSSAHEISDGENILYPEGEGISGATGFPEGSLLTSDYKNYFYVSGSGAKRKLSKNVFRATFSRGMAIKVSQKLLKKYKNGGSLSFQNGAVVNYRNKYFFVESGARRQFATKSLAVSMGYKNIVKAKRTEMAEIGEGAVIE
ncbi:MAG: peptidoglycan recognition family protein [Patescibacteria group bacterium]|nr:peptidoglycan recognition family protein [Patescibacteria group bacterium]